MKARAYAWGPAVLLTIGILLSYGFVNPQRSVSLRRPLAAVIPAHILGYGSRDVTISADEQQVAGMDTYLMREYRADTGTGAALSTFSLYVGYYRSQTQGKTIHSPKNCLPGAGWEPVSSRIENLGTRERPIRVNRYVLQRGAERSLVLYWYQGRGRIQASEYRVKWNLLRDSAVRGRSEEALVRIIAPITTSEDAAHALAARVARSIVPQLNTALPS